MAKEKAEKKAELERQLAKEFSENQESILSNARQLFDQGQYSKVIAISDKYASVNNSQLNELSQKVQVLNRQMEVNARQAEMDAVSEKYKIDMRYLCRQANSGFYENYDRAVSLCNHEVSNCRKNAGEKYESMKKGEEQMGKYWNKTDWYSVYKEDIEKCDAKLAPCSEELLKCYKKG